MIYTIIQSQNDSLPAITITKVTAAAAENTSGAISIWFWIALVEFLVITLIIYKSRKKKMDLEFADLPKDKFKSAKGSSIDMGNLMNSINGSKGLYKELSRLCHPDRFINTDKQEASVIIFQELTKHKRNFEKLSKLKEQAITELKIKIK